jgi:hypothetical protein
MTHQVKSKQRVANHGEVFTAEREVNAMLDLVKQETERPDGLVPYKIVLAESAMRNDGTCFTDPGVHQLLLKKRVGGVGDG